MAPSAKNAERTSSVATTGEPQSKKRAIELVDVEENVDEGAEVQVQTKFKAFRKYLEKGGAYESLAKSLVALYEEPEQPHDALGYLKNNFAGHSSLVNDLEAAKSENGQLKQRMETLEKELGAVKTENRQLKPKMEKQVWTNLLSDASTFAPLKRQIQRSTF